MSVGEERLHRVVSHRLERSDLDVAFAGLQGFLAGTMATYLGGWRVDPEKFIGKPVIAAVGECQFHFAGFLMQLDLGGDGGMLVQSGHGSNRKEVETEPI